MIQLTENIFAVPVPAGVDKLKMWKDDYNYVLTGTKGFSHVFPIIPVTQSYEFLCTKSNSAIVKLVK